MKRIAHGVSFAGSFLALFQGVRWLSDFSSDLAQLAARLLGTPHWAAAVALVIAGALGLVATLVTMRGKGRPRIQAVALVVLGLVPLLFSSRALFATPMTLGGLLVLLAYREGASASPTVPPSGAAPPAAASPSAP